MCPWCNYSLPSVSHRGDTMALGYAVLMRHIKREHPKEFEMYTQAVDGDERT